MSGGNKKIPLKRRHFISLEQKLQILNRLEKGERVSNVAKSLDLNEATIRTIQKSEHKIRASIAAGGSLSANVTSRPRAPIIEKMEKTLSIWIDDCSKKQIPLDINIVKQKALEIYNYLRENGESAVIPDFVASNGWFDRFRKRFSLQNLRIQGGIASADKGFDNTTVEDIQVLLVEEETGEADLVAMTSGICHNKSGDDGTGENEEVKRFTLKSVKKGLDLAEQLELYFLNEDPSTERSTKFKRELHKCLAPYNKLYKDLSLKASNLTDVLQKVEDRSQDNAEKHSEDEDILSKTQHTWLMVLSSDEENIT